MQMPVCANQQPTKTRRDWNQLNHNWPLISHARYHRMGQSMRPSRRSDFDIAIICTLSLEYDAVSYIFDEFWDEDGDQYGRAAGDTNHYTTGRMGNYSVVLALLPQMGKAGAASAAASMRSSYTGVRLALLTGVCGSVPHVGQHEEIFLGDVIISKTVFQYDFGWQLSDGFVHKNTVEDNLGQAIKISVASSPRSRPIGASIGSKNELRISSSNFKATLPKEGARPSMITQERRKTNYLSRHTDTSIINRRPVFAAIVSKTQTLSAIRGLAHHV
ncbi:uncharacterized protein TrAtP1_001162 [Trichoderma atroviride]|uniref:uncharacterized protein n=1 Tax=Hypocrea atroviridis TaxID=63577 RepID=UPI0033166A07|nr:hypothetical protein TrAtP1_001162 [Trichoderma atroviride]